MPDYYLHADDTFTPWLLILFSAIIDFSFDISLMLASSPRRCFRRRAIAFGQFFRRRLPPTHLRRRLSPAWCFRQLLPDVFHSHTPLLAAPALSVPVSGRFSFARADAWFFADSRFVFRQLPLSAPLRRQRQPLRLAPLLSPRFAAFDAFASCFFIFASLIFRHGLRRSAAAHAIFGQDFAFASMFIIFFLHYDIFDITLHAGYAMLTPPPCRRRWYATLIIFIDYCHWGFRYWYWYCRFSLAFLRHADDIAFIFWYWYFHISFLQIFIFAITAIRCRCRRRRRRRWRQLMWLRQPFSPPPCFGARAADVWLPAAGFRDALIFAAAFSASRASPLSSLRRRHYFHWYFDYCRFHYWRPAELAIIAAITSFSIFSFSLIQPFSILAAFIDTPLYCHYAIEIIDSFLSMASDLLRFSPPDCHFHFD